MLRLKLNDVSKRGHSTPGHGDGVMLAMKKGIKAEEFELMQ